MSLAAGKILAVLSIISNELLRVETVTCLSCTRLVHPSDCSRVRKCGQHEQCYTKQYIEDSGITWYDVGCMSTSVCALNSAPTTTVHYNSGPLIPSILGRRNDVMSSKEFSRVLSINGRQVVPNHSCLQCCNSTICNKGGHCDAKPIEYSGPICYSCRAALHADGCDQIEQCGASEYCFIGQSLNRVSREFRWRQGCQSSSQCSHIHKSRSTDDGNNNISHLRTAGDVTDEHNDIVNGGLCDDCCTGDLCNNICTNFVKWNAPLTSSSGMMLTSSIVYKSTTVIRPVTSSTALPTTTLDASLLATIDCDFESALCNWHQDKMDDGDWRLHQGGTSTDRTGPRFDHTYGNVQGHYIYMEASDLYYQNDIRLISGYVNIPDNTCLQFWYHMHGNYVGALNIVIKETNGNEKKLWSREGNQGDMWVVARVPMTSVSRGQLIIQAYRGADIFGDIAIDDIKILSGCS